MLCAGTSVGAKEISSTRARPREGMYNLLLCVLFEDCSCCMVSDETSMEARSSSYALAR